MSNVTLLVRTASSNNIHDLCVLRKMSDIKVPDSARYGDTKLWVYNQGVTPWGNIMFLASFYPFSLPEDLNRPRVGLIIAGMSTREWRCYNTALQDCRILASPLLPCARVGYNDGCMTLLRRCHHAVTAAGGSSCPGASSCGARDGRTARSSAHTPCI